MTTFLQGLSTVDKAAEDFARQLLAPNPSDRLTASAALGHPWLRTNTETTTVEISEIEHKSNYPIPADSPLAAVSHETQPLRTWINDSQSQDNYNTPSHAGLHSENLEGENQNTAVKATLVNQWTEADRKRMIEPMPRAAKVEQLDALDPFEETEIIVKEEKKSYIQEERGQPVVVGSLGPIFAKAPERGKTDQEMTSQNIPLEEIQEVTTHETSQNIPSQENQRWTTHRTSQNIPSQENQRWTTHRTSQNIPSQENQGWTTHETSQNIPSQENQGWTTHETSQNIPSQENQRWTIHGTSQNIPSQENQRWTTHGTSQNILVEVDLDSVVDRLLEVRGSRPGKQVQLLEQEIRYLCTKAREIFISQPILLELEAPIKVCKPLCSPSCRLFFEILEIIR